MSKAWIEMTAVSVDNYLWTTPILAAHGLHPQLIVEVGSLHGQDALYLNQTHGARLVVFEPDPINAARTRPVVEGFGGDFHEMALSDTDGEVTFWSVDPDLYENRGASSLLKIDFQHRNADDPDKGRAPIQRPVTVRSARYDSLGLPAPELLCIDVEGAEAMVLRGFGDLLREVPAVVIETTFSPHTTGGAGYPEIHELLTAAGLRYVYSPRYKESNPYIKWRQRLTKRRQSAFDCLYLR
jgi:FkbM family methyltransferase